MDYEIIRVKFRVECIFQNVTLNLGWTPHPSYVYNIAVVTA